MARRQYTEDEKAAALAYFEGCGKQVRKTARACKLPVATVHRWTQGGGLNAAVPGKVQAKKAEIADRLEAVVHMLLDNVPDHIDDAGLSEMFTSVGISVDKMRLLRSEPTSITETREQLEQQAREVLEQQGLRLVKEA